MFSQAALNASLNGKVAVHKAFMISAFVVSSVFLAPYLIYHYRVGHVAFQG
jgi:uncharacterized membrane protein YozB (DUF420 family)